MISRFIVDQKGTGVFIDTNLKFNRICEVSLRAKFVGLMFVTTKSPSIWFLNSGHKDNTEKNPKNHIWSQITSERSEWVWATFNPRHNFFWPTEWPSDWNYYGIQSVHSGFQVDHCFEISITLARKLPTRWKTNSSRENIHFGCPQVSEGR